MTEATAYMLASEMASSRYWEVTHVYHMPLTGDDGWEVRIQRRGTRYDVMRLVNPPTPELAANLNRWGKGARQ